MFENQSSQENTPPSNLPFQPDDMLAEVDKTNSNPPVASTPPDALSAGVLKKKEPLAYNPPQLEQAELNNPSYAMKGPVLGKVITFIIILLLLGGLAWGGWWLYGFLKQKNIIGSNTNIKNQISNPIPTNTNPSITPSTSSVTTDINNDNILFGEQTDSDKDNLDDRRESDLGTNASKADTDADGLNDGDEVLIWKTDPLNPDTDADGYKDGEEVRNGYNPAGAGKLFDSSSASTVTSTSSSTLVPSL